MKYHKDKTQYIVRLDKGELLIEQLNRLIKKEQIASAWVNGLGGAAWAELGFYDLEKQKYHWKRFDELMEITSLQGNIAVDEAGQTAIHLHGSFARSDMSGVGGHVKDLAVGGTCELRISMVSAALVRRKDAEVGLNLLDV